MTIGDNDYRIEAEPAGKPSPHFPLSALRGRRRESEERSPNPYSFNSEAFGGNGFRFQNPPEKNRHFQFLIDRTPEEIRSVMIGQRPQTVALIALVLTGNARKKLLDSLGARFREEIERRMGETEIPDERVISAVESALETTMIEKNVISPRSDHQNE